MNNGKVIINVKGLSKKFGKKLAVDNVDLKVLQGEIFGFLGPNGGGKTTTIRMLCGLLIPDAGSGTCLGFNILKDAYAIKFHIGYMTQRFSLYDDLTVSENLNFIAKLYGVANRQQAVNDSIARAGLEQYKNQLAGTLSGGWKQRLALEAALIHKPDLLLLDEPTAGVDPKARRLFWDRIHELAATGITALVSTHYMDEAERCHRLAYISQGKILVRGTKDEIIDHADLTTYEVKGDDLQALSTKLRGLKGIDQVVVFGSDLHVSGKDRLALQASIAKYQNDTYRWQEVSSSLEDIFINLIKD